MGYWICSFKVMHFKHHHHHLPHHHHKYCTCIIIIAGRNSATLFLVHWQSLSQAVIIIWYLLISQTLHVFAYAIITCWKRGFPVPTQYSNSQHTFSIRSQFSIYQNTAFKHVLSSYFDHLQMTCAFFHKLGFLKSHYQLGTRDFGTWLTCSFAPF